MTKPILFVSHTATDAKIAKTLKDELTTLLLHAVEVFVSTDPESLGAGNVWLQVVNDKLSVAKVVFIICNHHSVQRPWINFEAGGGWQNGSRVIPLCCCGFRIEELPQPLASLSALDLSNPRHLKELVKLSAESADLDTPKVDVEELRDRIESAAAERLLTADDHSFEIVRRMTDAFDEVARHIGKDVPPSERNRLINAAAEVVRPIGQMQQRLKDWDPAADDWIKDFHDDLSNYARVYATDIVERSSIGSSQFNRYLRKQFAARLESTRSMRGEQATLFSRSVLRAIERTGWVPDPNLWGACKESQTPTDTGLEIVRILIRPLSTVDQDESDALYVLHLDHRLHAIPLFVIDSDQLKPDMRADFAIGLGETGSIRRCYEYLRNQGQVRGVPTARAKVLARYFEKMLEDRTLMTVPEFLGNVMISDPEESKMFTAEYDELRVASDRIVEFIRGQAASAPKVAGLDIGCGTGNYTFPFLQDFHTVYGIDINEDLLRIARDKSKDRNDRLVLKRADAVKLPLDNESIGAVWSVSSLHYLKGTRQYYCLSEAYRVLMPGGRLVMDVGEFLEQHPSLWVTHYFPSLVQRYAGSLHSVDYYESALREIGFEDVRCVSLEYTSDESDYVLRSGQHDPERYLDQRFVAAIPAFNAMSRAELHEGQERIRRDRANGQLEAVIADCKAKARMEGDLGFIVASRP